MADQDGGAAQDAANAPRLSVLVQYTKDFSFENPNAPRSLGPQSKQPNIAIQVNVNAKQMSDTDFEVELLLEGTAGEAADILFKFELNYAGLFRLLNIPERDRSPVIMIECPRLLFPFARQIVADAVRAGGFPPLYVDPIDFNALYLQRMAQAAAAPTAGVA